MMQHSQTASSKWQCTDINYLLEEAVNLTYNGFLAKDDNFSIKIETSLDKSIGKINVIPQEIRRAFFNIINNSLYEIHKKRLGSDSSFSPTLFVQTKKIGTQVKICIRDNGKGIPVSEREKLFTPFFTTKPVGDGVGLGLSISYDIIVHQHKGQIIFETEEDSFTEFSIFLPT